MTIDKRNNYNYGLALLRVFMAFEVVIYHFWLEDGPSYLYPCHVLIHYAVPVFMFMSFFLIQKELVDSTREYRKERFKKLMAPQVAWAVIYFIIYSIYDLVMHEQNGSGLIDLIVQIITGRNYWLNPTMWFQTDLILLTLLFFGIFKKFSEKTGVIIISVTSIICLVLQYTEVNYRIFEPLWYDYEFTLGRLAEMMPIATLGFLFSKYKLAEPILNRRWINIILSGICIYAFVMLDRHVLVIENGFCYPGLFRALVGCAFVVFAYNLRFDFFTNRFPKFSSFITRYTLAMYCGHRLIDFFLSKVFTLPSFIRLYSFQYCVVIYIVGFCVFWAMSKIPNRWVKYIL